MGVSDRSANEPGFVSSFAPSGAPSFPFAPAAAPSSLLPFLPSSSPPPPPQSSTRPPPQLPYLLEPAAQAAIASLTLAALTTATSARHSVRLALVSLPLVA